MNKIVLSALAALTLSSVAANAGALKLYQDENGQVFTQAAEGRTLVTTPTPVYSKVSKLKVSGLFYLGYKYTDNDNIANSSKFEIRRGYFQAKAYLLDDPKSYFRLTYDVHPDDTGDEKVRAKYAYLYLNAIAPSTGVEIGLTHRPWHDYEEHNAWYFRDISKVLIEQKNGADLSNSADFGFMFKTRTQYFDADYGVFNGEGYHSPQLDNDSVSFEWRTTVHILGVDGKDKQNKKTYWDASFFGQLNQNHKGIDINNDGIIDRYDDLYFYGLHTVYNQPSFLLSAQYVYSDDTAANSSYVSAQAGSGYSVNGEYRVGQEKQYRAFARYDSWTQKQLISANEKEKRTYIAGLAWDQSKNVQWVANVTVNDNEDTTSTVNGTSYMVTAEVKF
ncbi:hypothetical protein [Sulfurimonas sp.]